MLVLFPSQLQSGTCRSELCILKAKLTNMLQTMPNSKKTSLVRRLKVSVGVAFKLSNRI